jgi:hypothetical protein
MRRRPSPEVADVFSGRIVRGLLLLAVSVAALALAGCCGDDWDDDIYDDDYYSYQKSLVIYLNVADQDGQPLEGATVWVDGAQQDERTAATYEELGREFPSDWVGWKYNWSGGPMRIDLRDWPRARAEIEILVSKTGYETQRTTILIMRDDADDIYMRQTFVMEQQLAPAGVAQVVDAPNPPEVISLK